MLCTALSFLVPASVAAADQIEVRDGKPILGRIQKETPTEVVIQGTGGTQTVPANRIAEIHYDGQGATLTQARILEGSRNLARAAEEYAKAQADLKGKPLILQAAQFGEARVRAKLAIEESSGVDQAIEGLEKFVRENAESRHHYPLQELLGRLYFEKKDFTKAAQAFAELAKAPWPEFKLRASLYQARLLLAQDKLDQAVSWLDEILAAKADATDQEIVQIEALLEKARCFRVRNQRENEIETLQKVLDRAPLDASSLQAEAYIALGDAYRATNKTKDALFAYLHIDLLFANHRELHARALYNLVQLWSELGQPEPAAAARATLKSEYANSPWNKKLGS